MKDLGWRDLLTLQDYYATVYSAEIVNTLTNLLFMWLGIKGVISCLRNKHDQIFLVAFCGYLVVGTGSFLFHSTLKCQSTSRHIPPVWTGPRDHQIHN